MLRSTSPRSVNFTALPSEVRHDLAEARWIAAQYRGHVVVNDADQLDTFCVRLLTEERGDFLGQRTQLHVDRLQRQLAGIDLREVQHVVDEAEQRVRGAARRLQHARAFPARSRSMCSRSSIPITPFIGVRIS